MNMTKRFGDVKITGLAAMIFLCAAAAACDGGGGSSDAATDDAAEGAGILYETCPVCASPPSCRPGEILTCCACVKPPQQEAGRASCSDMSEYCGTGAPDISCLKPAGYPVPGTPQMATVHGIVDVYATGPSSEGITVEFYAEGPDGALGALLGSATSDDTCAANEAALPVPHEVGEELALCPGICIEKMPDTTDCRTLAYFSTDDLTPSIPTNTPLIVKTSGPSTSWKDMYSYNIWFFDSEIQSGKVYYKARILSVDDWRNIPVAAGDTGGVAPGKSAVAGEIHDCGDVRLYYATVGTNPKANLLTYFNGVEEKLYPDGGRADFGTNLDGLYAAIEVDPDQLIWVTAIARIPVEGLVSLGWRKARTFPDSLTSVTLKGTRPDQAP